MTLPTSVSSATTPSCTWVVSSRPAGSTGTFSAPASCVSTTYRADVAGVHTVSFEATDAVGTTAQCNVEITAKAPVTASCPAPMTVFANSTVSLPTSVTSATTPTCAWSIGSRPTTSSGTFSAPTSCVTSDYFADVAGEHVLNFAVNDTLGSQATCSTAITVKPKGGLWVELTWDKDNDIDLHVAHPNASAWFNNPWDCYYSNKNPTWSAIVDANPHLDRDDTNFKGPENTRINVPETGLKYSIGVHFFASRSGSTVSTVRVYCDGALVTTRTRSITTVNSMWAVGTVEFSATSPCQVRAVDTVMPNAKLVIDAKE